MFEGSIAGIRGMILDSNITKYTALAIGLICLLLEAHATSGRLQCRGLRNNIIAMAIWGLSLLFYPNTLVACLLKYSGRHTYNN